MSNTPMMRTGWTVNLVGKNPAHSAAKSSANNFENLRA